MHEKIKQLLGNRSLIFGSSAGQANRMTPERFRRFVEFAVEYGATHIGMSIPFRYNSWVLPDNTDPYAAWCNCSCSFFRLCPPEELQEWITPAQVEIARESINWQLEIMRPYGLKGTMHANEPMWLPEGVYRAHPRWRGVQCELGRIASRPYYAPSIDEPEVLDLYRRAAREFSTLFPEVDEFGFLTNDSGGGLSWTPNVYPGLNGPTRWRTRDGGERIANWMKTLQEGSAEAGVTLRISMYSSGLPRETVVSTQDKLAPGLFLNGGNSHDEGNGGPGAGLGGGLWSVGYPALSAGSPAGFLGGALSVYHNPKNDSTRCGISLDVEEIELARMLLDIALDNPGTGRLHHTEVALIAATKLTGSPELGEQLLGIWERVGSAQHAIGQIRQKGFGLVLPFCGVSMRWLIRPLVPAPEELTPEETAHYRNFMFAIESQKDDPHFGLVLGKGVFRGESVMWMSRWCLQEAIDTLRGAQHSALAIAKKMPEGADADRIQLYAARIGVQACLAANIKNTIMYQYALDVADQPQYGPNAMDYDDNIIFDQRALTMRKSAREELDNINELIALIETSNGRVIEHAESPEEESVFMFGPNLLNDLKRKVEIMLDHWQDYEDMYPTTKVWDFEPESRGNIV